MAMPGTMEAGKRSARLQSQKANATQKKTCTSACNTMFKIIHTFNQLASFLFSVTVALFA
jgi:hypothetical protein